MHRALRLVGSIAFALSLSAGLAAQEIDQAEYKQAATTILCDCGCHPQSIDQCACGRATEMREEVMGYVRQGMTGEEVIALYVERHGEQIRIAPTARGFNLVAWLGPLFGLLSATGGMFFILRRWRKSPPAAPVDTAETTASDPVYQRRLRDALENFE